MAVPPMDGGTINTKVWYNFIEGGFCNIVLTLAANQHNQHRKHVRAPITINKAINIGKSNAKFKIKSNHPNAKYDTDSS